MLGVLILGALLSPVLLLSFPPQLLEGQEGRAVQTRPAALCPPMILEETERPGWTVSGTWVSDDELVLVDTLHNRLLRYASSRRYLGLETKSLVEFSEPFRERGPFFPSAIDRVNTGIWMELWDSRFARLTPDFSLVSLVDILNLKTREGKTLESIFSWSAAGDDIIVYAGLPEGEAKSSGFYRVSFDVKNDRVSDVKLLQEISRQAQSWVWYRLAYQYITDHGETAILLGVDGEKLRILTHDPGQSELVPMELDASGPLGRVLHATPPHLPKFQAPSQFVDLMKVVESSTMPTGLYGWEDRLYVAWRRPQGEVTQWLLTKINPYSHEELGTTILPTTANHTTLIPGPKYWALVEKGPVLDFGLQVVSSIRFIPSESIRAAFSLTPICG